MRALESWHLLVLVILALPLLVLVVVLVGVLVNRRRSTPPSGGAVPPNAPIFTDPGTGRRYTVDPASGRSVWFDAPPPPE